MVNIFSDEKLLTVDCVINRKNDQFFALKGDNTPPVCHTKHLQLIMILGVVALNSEKYPSVYIKGKEKVNVKVYIDVVPWFKKTFPDRWSSKPLGPKDTSVSKDNMANF